MFPLAKNFLVTGRPSGGIPIQGMPKEIGTAIRGITLEQLNGFFPSLTPAFVLAANRKGFIHLRTNSRRLTLTWKEAVVLRAMEKYGNGLTEDSAPKLWSTVEEITQELGGLSRQWRRFLQQHA